MMSGERGLSMDVTTQNYLCKRQFPGRQFCLSRRNVYRTCSEGKRKVSTGRAHMQFDIGMVDSKKLCLPLQASGPYSLASPTGAETPKLARPSMTFLLQPPFSPGKEPEEQMDLQDCPL
jgi:hypothetical protein